MNVYTGTSCSGCVPDFRIVKSGLYGFLEQVERQFRNQILRKLCRFVLLVSGAASAGKLN